MSSIRPQRVWSADGEPLLRDPDAPLAPVEPALTALPDHADVVIVGGGPTGSALALELALRGVTPLVLERREDIQTSDVRARNISVRTMETARRWGVAGALRARQALPDDWYRGWVIRTRVAGHDLCEPLYGDRPAWTPHAHWHELSSERPLDLPQYHVNRVLRDRALQLGAVFAPGWEVTQVEDGAAAAWVTVVGEDDVQHRIRAGWVVGCDGARSVVRRSAGIGQTVSEPRGRLFNVVFRLENAFAVLGLPPAALMFVFNQDVAGMVSPIDGDRWRLGVGPVPLDEAVDHGDIAAHVRLYLGADVDVEILSVSSYLVQKRIADTRRAGRLLLAGDAAQGFPPHLGQLLNAGVADAVTLGWALAAVVRGWGGETLLDAYSQERQAVAHRLADATLEICAATTQVEELIRGHGDIEGDDEASREARSRLGEAVRGAMASGSDGLIFDLRHTDSPIVVDDGGPAVPEDPHRVIPSSRPGHRAPHAWLAPEDPLSDHLGAWFTLLDLGAAATDVSAVATAFAVAGVPLSVLAVADRAVRDLYEQPLVLVRPDGVVAWRGADAPADVARLVDVLRGVHAAVPAGAAR